MVVANGGRFGCYVFPDGFDFQGYSAIAWQRWWEVGDSRIWAADARYSRIHRQERAQAPTPMLQLWPDPQRQTPQQSPQQSPRLRGAGSVSR